MNRLEPAWKSLHPGYDRVVRFIAERERRVMPGGEDRWRFDGLYQDFPYERIEPHVYRWIAQNVQPGTRFYDIGAFIGYHTLCAAKRVGDEGGVFAFEPGPSNLAVLEHNLRLNRLGHRVRTFGVAVGAQDQDSVSFYLRREDPTTHSLAYIPKVDHVTESTLTRVDVTMRSIDSIVDETKQPPTLMKIDVEGAEGRVLEGARTTLREHRIPIVCAIHPPWLAQLGDDVDSIRGVIRSLGYRAVDFNGNMKTSFGFEEILLLPD
ncbi:MAG: FkbM family methyltransferase [Gemmatimonadales bacterium]